MIEVVRDRVYRNKDQDEVLDKVVVDADRVVLRTVEHDNTASTVLVLFKGQEEVAWFDAWESAIKVSNLWEYTDE